jgi:hypothetical protein
MHMLPEVLDFFVYVLVKEVLDSPATRKEVTLGVRSILDLVFETFRAPICQDVIQFSIFVRSFTSVFPEEPTDIHVCMQGCLEHQELWRVSIFESRSFTQRANNSLRRQ